MKNILFVLALIACFGLSTATLIIEHGQPMMTNSPNTDSNPAGVKIIATANFTLVNVTRSAHTNAPTAQLRNSTFHILQSSTFNSSTGAANFSYSLIAGTTYYITVWNGGSDYQHGKNSTTVSLPINSYLLNWTGGRFAGSDVSAIWDISTISISNFQLGNASTTYDGCSVKYTVVGANFTKTRLNDSLAYGGCGNGSYYGSYTAANTLIQSDFGKTAFSAADPSQYCKAYIYYGTSLILPKITYIVGQDAFGDFYNASSAGVSYLKNNSAHLVLDSTTGLWFSIVPTYTCANYNDVGLAQGIIYPTTGSGGIPITLPTVFPIQNCYESSGYYYWNITGTTSQTFTLNKTATPTNYTTTSTGVSYSGSINTTNATRITISANGFNICAWQNGSNVLFSSIPFLTADATTNLFGKVIIVGWVGISVIAPYAAIGIFLFNDIFSIMTQSQAFMVALITVFMGAVVNAFSERNLKNIGFYFAIGLFIIVYYTGGLIAGTSVNTSCIPTIGSQTIGTAGASILTNLNTSMANASGNIGAFFLSIVQFIIDVVGFTLNLPAFIAAGLFAPLACINSNLYNAAVGASSVVSVGVLLYLLVKGYEVIANRFQKI